VTAVHNGVAPQFVPQPPEVIAATRKELGLPDRFFLCVGTIEPRKNLGTVIRAFADLPPAVREACPLVLAGPWGWRSDADRKLFEEVGASAGVRQLGYVPARLLPALYAAARVLLYPSHYEGFGLPPVEMLACGGAVIASTADAVQEVVGECGKLVEPEDVAGWRDLMHEAATDDEFLEETKRGGVARAAAFTWTRAAHETMAVYRKVLSTPAA
jgi:alpha-1,3-rhamnosyl/mannosyltransferase